MILKEGRPVDAGMHPAIVDRLQARGRAWSGSGLTQAVVLLAARQGVIFFHEAYGIHGPGEGSPPVQKNALFPLASLTKPFTATSLMILVEEGLVGLNHPVLEYIPEFRGENKDRVMVHHLLTHTSGLTDDQVLAWLENIPESIEIPDTPQNQHPFINRVLALTYASSLQFEPGERMNYTGLGYYLAGEIVRRVSGSPLNQFARERILQPLGMEESFFIVPESHWPRVVQRPEDAPGGTYHLPELLERPSPSGGMYGTARDMAAFCQMFLNQGVYGEQRVLSPAAVSAMTRNQIPGVSAALLDFVFPEASWGLGWSVYHPLKGRVYGESLPSQRYFCHGGLGGVEVWMDPEHDLLGVYFATSLKADQKDFTIHQADRFMNMVSAAVDRGGTTSPGPRTRQPSARQAEDGEIQPGSPGEAGVSQQRLDRLHRRAREWVEEGIHPAIVMLGARRGTVFLHTALGSQGPEKDAPRMRVDTIFPLASISKPITATAIMILVEEGLIGLNQQVDQLLPEFTGEDKGFVTIRHLLTHTSGLRDEEVGQFVIEKGREAHNDDIASEEAYFTNRFDAPLSTFPDEMMYYADFNYDLLGEIVSRVSGTNLSEFSRQRIFQPLGMTETSFQPSAALRDRLVRRPDTAPFAAHMENMVNVSLGSRGAVSSARDLAVFGQMFLNGGRVGGERVLSPASVDAMTRNQIPGVGAAFNDQTFQEGEWGLGWSIQRTKRMRRYGEHLLAAGTYCHGGSGGVMLWVDPAQELVAVFLSTIVDNGSDPQGLYAIDLFINALAASIVDRP